MGLRRESGVMMILAVTLTLAQAAGLPAPGTCGALMLTSPRDEWRLTVTPDGSARINYAALPQTVESPARTFDFEELHASLAKRSATGARAGAGAVECRSSRGEVQGTPMPFDDEGFAALQFERAWNRASSPSDAVGQEHFDLLRSMWLRRQRPR
jgi:hypothetical protein